MDTDREEPQTDDVQSPELEDGRTPPPDDLDSDPAYNPDDPGLEDIKGG